MKLGESRVRVVWIMIYMVNKLNVSKTKEFKGFRQQECRKMWKIRKKMG